MKFRFILLFIAALLWGCNRHSNGNGPSPTEKKIDGARQIEKLWENTTPFVLSQTRLNLFDTIQNYADRYSSDAFHTLLKSDDKKYRLTVDNDNLLVMYDMAFERILLSLKENKPQKGEVIVWHLFNIGYVVQTPTSSFGIDIYHYRGEELAPYLDFLCSTHTHSDHKWLPLMEKMYQLGKPVLTNYFLPENNYKYTAQKTQDYTIGACQIHTSITRHNNSSTNIPVTLFQIDMGDATNGFVLLHSGDSNFTISEYDINKSIDLYIPRYAQTPFDENKVIDVLNPKYTLLSHILELGHKDVSSSRWPLSYGIERAKGLHCEETYMPFWGEKIVFRNKVMVK